MQTAAVRLVAWVAVPLVCLGLWPAAGADEPATLKAQSVFFKVVRDDPKIVGRERTIELVQLPPGKITLKGPDGRDHEYEVKPVWIARYETRWDEYDAFWKGLDLGGDEMEAGRKRQDRWQQWFDTGGRGPYMPPYGAGPDAVSGYPADCVTLRAARTYCAWLSKLTGRKFRLPTEVEWEYACRAGGGPVKPNAKVLDRFAWFAANAGGAPHPVGQKEPNAWGLYDMLGNVGEFVIRDAEDDKGLLAGGSYKDDAEHVHSGARERYSPDWQKFDPEDPKRDDWLDYGSAHHVGFRVVMED